MHYPPGHPFVGQSIDLAFVITSPSNIPTVSEWGLIVMALMLLTAGTLVLARRRMVLAGAGGASGGNVSVSVSGRCNRDKHN